MMGIIFLINFYLNLNNMTKIKNIISRQIFDSRGNPTVETDVITTNGVVGRAAVPSGASTGQHEAIELRDELNSYMGKSVYNAVKNVNDIIFKELENLSVFDQSLRGVLLGINFVRTRGNFWRILSSFSSLGISGT